MVKCYAGEVVRFGLSMAGLQKSALRWAGAAAWYSTENSNARALADHLSSHLESLAAVVVQGRLLLPKRETPYRVNSSLQNSVQSPTALLWLHQQPFVPVQAQLDPVQGESEGSPVASLFLESMGSLGPFLGVTSLVILWETPSSADHIQVYRSLVRFQAALRKLHLPGLPIV